MVMLTYWSVPIHVWYIFTTIYLHENHKKSNHEIMDRYTRVVWWMAVCQGPDLAYAFKFLSGTGFGGRKSWPEDDTMVNLGGGSHFV